MNPPPPMLPAAGSTTASANATATAASTAFPPRFKISTPACEPSCSSVATIPCAARTACFGQSFESTGCGRNSAAACERTETAQPNENANTKARCFERERNTRKISIRRQTLRDSRNEVKKLRRDERQCGVCGESAYADAAE